MNPLVRIAAWAALALTIVPSIWMLVERLSQSPGAAEAGVMTDARLKALMAVGAVLWFVAAPFWLKDEAA